MARASNRSTPSLNPTALFRLKRHHLLDDTPADPVTLCRDICGAQAQIPAAACLQLWARNHLLTRQQIEAELWTKRTLVRTWVMRRTVHIIAAADFWIYITALRRSRVNNVLRVMKRCGISATEADDLTHLTVAALDAGSMDRAALTAVLWPQVSKRVRAWMNLVGSIVQVPVAEGLVCCGPGEGNSTNFVRVDRWLPKLKARPMTEVNARSLLLQRYLQAYGPATIQDFAHWSGLPMSEVKPLRDLAGKKLVEITEGKSTLLLTREDANSLEEESCPLCVRLLPHFDPYLLAHREKEHLIATHHYKRVYRNQGWISPVVLVNGSVAGTWSHKQEGKNLAVKFEPFAKLSPDVKAAVEQEATALAQYFGLSLKLSPR